MIASSDTQEMQEMLYIIYKVLAKLYVVVRYRELVEMFSKNMKAVECMRYDNSG